jgi:branched-chain amino acid transport system substrate-binding protein
MAGEIVNDRGLRADGIRRLARRSSRHSPTVAALVVALLLAGCGTRLPSAAFTRDPSGGATAPGSTNPAGNSDVGVTATTIKLGLVVSKTSPLGAETFTPSMYGVQAFVAALNARGGVAGRRVDLVVCDDGATGAGNRRCVTKLIDQDHIFAFVGNSIFDYAGASFVNDRGVPDVGGQPISSVYDQYRHLWSIYGSSSARDGSVGWNGKLLGGTEVYRFFATTLGTKTAGVVAYNQPDSLRFANLTAAALKLEGYTVVREQLDFAVPAWNSAAIDMRSRGVDVVFDALDSAGNVSLCNAMDAAGLVVKAKAVTVQGWNETVRADYRSAPKCRNSLYATATTRNYMDTDNPAIARFRSEMTSAFPTRDDKLSMWTLEGWAGAQWLTDAIASCTKAVTRTCVETFLSRPEGYDGGGAFLPRNFIVRPIPPTTDHNCIFAARWSDAAYEGAGGWVTVTPGKQAVCYDVPNVPYSP